MRWRTAVFLCASNLLFITLQVSGQATKDLLCSEKQIICVRKSLEHSAISVPLQFTVEVHSSENIQVTWKVKDEAGQTLEESSTYDYVDDPFVEKTGYGKAFHIKDYWLKPSTSLRGTLILTPSIYSVSTGAVDLPKLEIPIRLTRATTEVTTLLPSDEKKYWGEVINSIDEDKGFDPSTPLAPKKITVMRVESDSIAAVTAEAVLREYPGQGPWHVVFAFVEGDTAHIRLSADGWAGVSYYGRAVGVLLERSVLRLPNIKRVDFR